MSGRSSTRRVALAGLPYATVPGGTSLVTTDPDPTIAPSPIVTYGKMVTFTPIWAPTRMSGPAIVLDDLACPGNRSFAMVTPGARNTSSSSSVNWAT